MYVLETQYLHITIHTLRYDLKELNVGKLVMVFPLCGQKEKARFTHSGGISLICEKSKLKGISSPCFLLTQIFFMALTHHRHIYMYMYKGPPFLPLLFSLEL